jgi:hypothetical protein
MRFRAMTNITSFFVLPTIIVVFDKTWWKHYEIAFAWFNWYLCLEWGSEY